MAEQHTPGPWSIGWGNPISIDGRDCTIAEVHWTTAQRGSHTTNALLIAAAPELREALLGLLSLIEIFAGGANDLSDAELAERTNDAADRARAAIAKATGEPRA